MKIEISRTELQTLLEKQVDTLFGLKDNEKQLLARYIDAALDRCARCFAQNPNKYYMKEGEAYFNPFHSVQYMTFLYYLGNTIYKEEKLTASILCDKLYYLNKTLNGIDLFYTVDLPDFFMAEHPVGTVIGKGTIGNGFLFYQCCNIGGFHEKDGTISYPVLGENVRLFANAAVIGRCKIGNNVNIGAGACVKNQDIPDNTTVFGQSPNLVIKQKIMTFCPKHEK